MADLASERSRALLAIHGLSEASPCSIAKALTQTRSYSASEPCDKACGGATLTAVCRLPPMRRTTV